jgi:hypothetical protein
MPKHVHMIWNSTLLHHLLMVPLAVRMPGSRRAEHPSNKAVSSPHTLHGIPGSRNKEALARFTDDSSYSISAQLDVLQLDVLLAIAERVVGNVADIMIPQSPCDATWVCAVGLGRRRCR